MIQLLFFLILSVVSKQDIIKENRNSPKFERYENGVCYYDEQNSSQKYIINENNTVTKEKYRSSNCEQGTLTKSEIVNSKSYELKECPKYVAFFVEDDSPGCPHESNGKREYFKEGCFLYDATQSIRSYQYEEKKNELIISYYASTDCTGEVTKTNNYKCDSCIEDNYEWESFYVQCGDVMNMILLVCLMLLILF